MAVPTRSEVEAIIAERIAADLELVAGGACWEDLSYDKYGGKCGSQCSSTS